MAKPYFTLNLDVVGKPCLVIGGDDEALEKSERLLEAKADLTVVAKKAIPSLVEFLKKNGGKLELREVTPADIAGKFFVLNCVKTEPALSKWIYDELSSVPDWNDLTELQQAGRLVERFRLWAADPDSPPHRKRLLGDSDDDMLRTALRALRLLRGE